jgi:GAF domain-containing protein
MAASSTRSNDGDHGTEGSTDAADVTSLDPLAGTVDVEADADASDLRASLIGLSRLATGRMELTDLLTRVAEYAVRAIPNADGAGLTLIEEGRADTIVASAPFVAQVDAIQYGIEEGPCITAAREGRTLRSGGLGNDPQWPRFGPRVERLGVHSALSLPLITGHEALGAMNIYAHVPNAFDERAASIGELFAVPAAIAVQNAQVLAQTKRLAIQLQAAMTNRAVIDQAIGIIRSRTGADQDEAFARLRRLSQGANTKLSAIAQRLVEEAVQRARSHHSGGNR